MTSGRISMVLGDRIFSMVHHRTDDQASNHCVWSTGPIDTKLHRDLPGLDRADFRWVWLRPGAGRFTARQMNGLSDALRPLRLIGWFPPPTFVANKNPRDEPDRFSGRFAVEIDNLAIEYSSFVRWIAKADYDIVAELLQPLGAAPLVRFRVALAAIPYDSIVAARFSKAVQGPAWLWLCPEWISNATVPSLNSAAVVASYAKLVADIGGLVFLTWQDGRDRTGVAALGPKSQIDSLAAALAAHEEFVEYPKLLSDLNNTGVGFGMFYAPADVLLNPES